ncbi:DNA polymerase Y family protein [Marinibaculum pumilum]|uniref:DNA-directed DNA polymerase n=1 Tax=Marinibaculum pumilum TaxID=1766165 RepID=A0ABV7L857_9PROT
MKRFLALWLPYWPTDRLSPTGDGGGDGGGDSTSSAAWALTESVQGGVRLFAVDRRAAALGLRPGMSAADARALLPELRCREADRAADDAALQRLVRWCGRYSPWVAADGADGVRMDISGCAHLFGGEAAMACDLAGRLRARGLVVRLAIADSAAAAWALARFAAGERDGGDAAEMPEEEGILIAPPGEREAPLRPLPLAALRLEPARLEALNRVGLRRIGDLIGLPRASLARRFGADLLERLDAALARAERPLSPAMPVPDWRVRLTFPEPVALRGDLDAGCLRLLQALCARLERDGRGARRLTLTLYRSDGDSQDLQIGTARPVRDPGHLMRLFAERLGEAAPGFGIDVMILSAPVTEWLPAEQAGAPAAVLAPPEPVPEGPVSGGPAPAGSVPAGGGDHTAPQGRAHGFEAALAPLLDRLTVRLGAAQVRCLLAVEAHLPELAERYLPALEAAGSRSPAGSGAGRWDPAAPPRPVSLLPRPEPVAVEAVAAGDAPPLLFRWRRVLHRVVAAEGPERIAPPWWQALSVTEAPLPPARDYYRVEDAEGRRFWLFRLCHAQGGTAQGSGAQGSGAQGTDEGWFLHGLCT